MAGSTGFEPATSGLTVQCANQAAPRARTPNQLLSDRSLAQGSLLCPRASAPRPASRRGSRYGNGRRRRASCGRSRSSPRAPARQRSPCSAPRSGGSHDGVGRAHPPYSTPLATPSENRDGVRRAVDPAGGGNSALGARYRRVMRDRLGDWSWPTPWWVPPSPVHGAAADDPEEAASEAERGESRTPAALARPPTDKTPLSSGPSFGLDGLVIRAVFI